jgi:HD-like signal output (HDOD) protein
MHTINQLRPKDKYFQEVADALWLHSLGTGICASVLARHIDKSLEELAFMGGLFHDIGKIFYLLYLPQVWDSCNEFLFKGPKHIFKM